MTGIYQILNTVNNKRYIGSAVNFEVRWKNGLRVWGGGFMPSQAPDSYIS